MFLWYALIGAACAVGMRLVQGACGSPSEVGGTACLAMRCPSFQAAALLASEWQAYDLLTGAMATPRRSSGMAGSHAKMDTDARLPSRVGMSKLLPSLP